MAVELERAKSRGMVFGTERCRKILDNLGAPDRGLKTVHIAGTNGKGSVAEFVSEIIRASGAKVGTYTSPAVYDYFDGFRINLKELPRAALDGYLAEAAGAAEGLKATLFEIETAAALYAFSREGCAYAVIECGLGGLSDATNAIEKKEVALITSIGLEHTAILGGTIEQICAQKAGIIIGCPAIASALQPEEARRYFERLGVKIADGGLEILKSGVDGTEFLYGGKRYKTRAIGPAQPYNAALAIECAKILKMPESAIYSGVNCANPQGRLQLFKLKNNNVILDGAHNPASFMPLASLLKSGAFGKPYLVISCLSDKDLRGNLNSLKGLFCGVTAVESRSARAMPVGEIVSICGEFFEKTDRAESVEEALNGAISRAETVVVCGSFTILEDSRKWIEKRL